MRRCCAFFLFLTLLSLNMMGYSDHRDRKIDSLEHVLKQEAKLTWEERVHAHSELMWGYINTDSPRTVKHAKAILSLTKNGKGLLSRHYAYRLIGQCAYGACLYDSAMHCYEIAEQVAMQMGDCPEYTQTDVDDALSSLYGTIGNTLNMQGMSTLALEYYLKALKIFEREGWHESEAILYYNVGEMFLEMGNNDEAHHYYLLSQKAAAQTNDSLIQIMPLQGLSMSLLNLNKPDSAMEAARVTLDYYLAHFDQEFAGAMNTYVSMARIAYHGHGDVSLAQHYLDEAYPISERIDTDNADVSDLYCFQAELCSARKEWQQTVYWAQRALEKNDEDPHHNVGVYKLLSKAYAHLGQGEESERYTQLMHAEMEALANQQHQSALSEMQVRYETQKKEAELERMKSRQHMLLVIYITATVALLVLALMVWAVMRHRRQMQLMKAKLLGEADERQRLARDLHDRLGGMLTVTRLSLEAGRTAESAGLLQQTHAEMRKVAHHLMPASLSRSGLDVAISEYCQVLPHVHYTLMGESRRFDEQMEVLAYCVLHELVNNALKHAQARNITLQLLFEEKKLTCVVQDDGIGFVESEEKGMGLKNVRERVSVVGGEFSLHSVPGQGTEVYFTLPI